MLTPNEKLAVLTFMDNQTPIGSEPFISFLNGYPDKVATRKMLNLRDELDLLVAEKDKEIKTLRRVGQSDADELHNLKKAIEMLAHKIINGDDDKLKSSYEFKEIKALLDLY